MADEKIEVEATDLGYYGHKRRRKGDVFKIDGAKDKKGNVIAFSEKWMKKVETPATREGVGGAEITIKPKKLTQMNKAELLAKAEELELMVPEGAVNATIIGLIEEALEKQNDEE